MPCYVSVSHRFEDRARRSLPLPFAVENPRPGTQIESAGSHGHDDLVPNRDRSQMGRGIVLAGPAVVTVLVRVPRSDRLLEPIEDILPQIRLMIVYEHRRRDVHSRGEDHAFANARGGATRLDRVGDVDDLLSLLRFEREVVGMRLHRGWSQGGWACEQSVCLTSKPLSHAS